jgi:heterodisulfide reductase subunit B
MVDENFFSLYTGCLIRTRLPHLEKSTRAVFENFGIHFYDLEGASCCPDPVGMKGVDQETWLTMAARNLSLVRNNSHTLMTLCSGCYSTFREVQHRLANNASWRERINDILKQIGYHYSAGPPVEHFARFLFEKVGSDGLSSRITDSWKGLPVAIHHGCHFLRPSHLGAEVVDYPRKMICCGFTIQGMDSDLSLGMAHEKLMLMKEYGARAVIVVCPSCYLQFDLTQRAIEQKFDVSLQMPVFYLTEFIGLALGLKASSLGLNFHRVDAIPLIREIFPEEE